MDIRILSLLLFFLCSAVGDISAQSKMGRYHKNMLYEADLYYAQGDYYYAAELYQQLSQVEPDNGELLGKLGICYFNLPPFKEESLRYLELGAKNGDTESLYFLAKWKMAGYQFFDAIKLIETYENKADRMKTPAEIIHFKEQVYRAKDYMQTPAPVTVQNLGEQINSEHHDYAPVWDRSSNRLYFTSRRRMDDKSEKDFTEQFDENIYVVDLAIESNQVKPARDPFNSRSNDAAVACSQDGTSMIIFRTSKNGFSGDLFLTERTGGEWSELEKLSDVINTKHHEASATFGSRDGSVLYFSSDQPDGYGGKDLFKVQKLPDGSWGQAVNLGEKINTPFDDDAPYVAANGSLYFASKGHENMGGYDIFCSKMENGEWQKPGNLGYPINTPGDDIFFVLDDTGNKGYFSSERAGGLGLQDLYEVSFDESNAVIVKGSLTSQEDGVPGNATVKLIDEDAGRLEGVFQADPQEGKFVLALNTNKNYLVRVEAEGFKTFEKELYFRSRDAQGFLEVNETLILSK
jgi:tetratricopeptide (TPR) repeat protein